MYVESIFSRTSTGERDELTWKWHESDERKQDFFPWCTDDHGVAHNPFMALYNFIICRRTHLGQEHESFPNHERRKDNHGQIECLK